MAIFLRYCSRIKDRSKAKPDYQSIINQLECILYLDTYIWLPPTSSVSRRHRYICVLAFDLYILNRSVPLSVDVA